MKHQIGYFYLPAGDGRSAEIIEIINCDKTYIQVPMREEDVELEMFFMRAMTEMEKAKFGITQTWQIFDSWLALEEDHVRLLVSNALLSDLLSYKNKYSLPEGMAA